MKDVLTIIIPTHNRPALLARALDYYNRWGCSVIVCDSSKQIPEEVVSANIRTMYTPELSFDRKLASAVKQVVTPYTCLSADDDFLATSGVVSAIKYLEEHKDYVSVQGHYVGFDWEMDQLVICPGYIGNVGFHIDDANPEQRIIRSMNPYMHQIYAVTRSDVLQRSFAITLEHNTRTLAEFSTALLGMLCGKHRMLPMFWMARDAGRYTEYNYNKADQDTIVYDIGEFLATSDGISYRGRLAEAYAFSVGCSVAIGLDVIDRAFIAYKDCCSDHELRHLGEQARVLNSLRQVYRQAELKFLPKAFKRQRRLQMEKIRAKYIYSKLPGFPFSRSSGSEDLETIKSVILKHGPIAQVEDRRAC